MKHFSPLRYPGGKACLTKFLTDFIELNDVYGCQYFEPFAGGAGAALQLLENGVASEIHINDADIRIATFWRSILNKTEEFVDRIFETPLSIDEWRKQYSVCRYPSKHKRLDVAFAAFFMNRCNRSGVLIGAGPIGGYEQAGKWRLDVRFNREELAQRVLRIARRKSRIHVTQLDALDFLRNKLPRGSARKSVLVYLDPPYVNKGQRLYLNAYNPQDHRELADYIKNQIRLPWLMSYDDTELVRNLYRDQQLCQLPIQYSLQNKRVARELIIAPTRLRLPSGSLVHGRTVSSISRKARATKK